MKLRTLFLLLLLLWAAIGFSQNAAILFDGTMDEVYMGDLAFSSTSYTAECWIYPTNLPTMTGTDENYCRTIFASSQLAGSYPVWIGTTGNKLKVWSYSTNQDTGGQLVGGTLNTNTWYHIAITTTKGGTTKVYVNGVEQLSFTNLGEGDNWNERFTVGDLRPGRDLGFYGKILDVRIWDVIRTQEEIQYGMNNDLIGNETGLIGYWPFNEGSDTVANDIQTNGTQHDGLFGATHSAPNGQNPTWTTGFSTTVEMGSPNPSVPETIVTQSNMIKLPLTHFTLTTTATVAPLLNSVTFSTSGTYLATEVANFKLWYNTTNDLSTASQIGSTITSSLGTGIHSFTGLTQALSTGSTRYLWITTDIQMPVTPGAYIQASLISASDFNTSSGFKTGYTSAGGIQVFESTLPVELSSFTATTTAQYFVQLHWVTQSETDVLGYMVLRSDVNNLEHAHQVSPLITATNTSAQATYSYTDTEVSPGTWYYWLQSIDLGGSFVFHGPVLATVANGQDSDTPDIPNSNGISKIYPNPFNPNATIVYGLKEASSVTISIYNAKGQLIQKHDLSTKEAGMHNFRWDADGLPAGTYLIRMQADNENYYSKAVISK